MAMQHVFVCHLALATTAGAAGRFRSKQPIMPAQMTAQGIAPVQDLTTDFSAAGASLAQPQAPATPLSANPATIPQAQVLLPVAAPLVVAQQPGSPKEATKLAFGQITDLGSEFRQLREDDQAHTKQLSVDVHLREKLEVELHQAEERLGQDNLELAEQTTGIAAPAAESQVVEAAQTQPADPQNSSIAVNAVASLVQATVSSAPSDPIAADVAKDVKAINGDIGSLNARDTQEIHALKGNADTRKSLSDQIAKEREELDKDAGGLASNLEQIQGLIGAPVTDGSSEQTLAQNGTLQPEPLLTDGSSAQTLAQNGIPQPEPLEN